MMVFAGVRGPDAKLRAELTASLGAGAVDLRRRIAFGDPQLALHFAMGGADTFRRLGLMLVAMTPVAGEDEVDARCRLFGWACSLGRRRWGVA